MNEFSPQLNNKNQHSDILAADAQALAPQFDNGPDTAPIKLETGVFVAESPYDTADTEKLSKNELRRALKLGALSLMSMQERQQELRDLDKNALPASAAMHIDGRIPGQVSGRDARDAARQNQSKFVQMLNQRQR